jgi:hypothetical protein
MQEMNKNMETFVNTEMKLYVLARILPVRIFVIILVDT